MKSPLRVIRRLLSLRLFSTYVLASMAIGYGVTPPSTARAETPDTPVRALLVTGGCCHDYDRQKLILTKGVSARANVVWTVVHQGGTTTDTMIPLYNDPKWAEGFDVVVHNECFAHVKDKAWVDRVLKPHREGTPAVLIHCAMHCYRTGDDSWFEFVGLQSPGHGAHYGFSVENMLADHPIMKDFGESWRTPKGELYETVKLWPTATPLAQAKRKGDNKPQTCVWTNEYHDTRVFGTTLSHYNEVMADPKYLDMLTRGILWAADRLDEEIEPLKTPDEETNQKILALVDVELDGTKGNQPKKTVGGQLKLDGNLAFESLAKASHVQKGHEPPHAIDGDLGTRWCGQGDQTGQTWQVDLGEARHLRSLRLHWEFDNVAYSYTIDASADGEEWKTIVDASKNKDKGMTRSHKVDSPDTRHLRVNFVASSTSGWASIWEFEAYEGDLPDLPKSAKIGKASGGGAATIADVTAPKDFDVTMFGAPPEVNYPVCLTAAPTGEVFVGVDEQGSLGKEKDGGKIIRCKDIDGDGKCDEIIEFARVDHPRGLIYDQGTLWVLHPPHMSVYFDHDRDGVADQSTRLITGISTDYVQIKGADHTTNGIRMGIDGWIYIAVGDFGFTKAVARDGTTLSKRGGGIVRIRPDGSDMEIFSWGQRNILDVCIDPYLNMFTRDNTNDGGGWDIRVSHILQTANYGYPSLYKNFSEEIMPPLADVGGGSGCGAMYVHDLRWPEPYGNAAYTCDWGRSEVYRHNFPQNDVTFDQHEETFIKIPKPTDIDIDGSGRMYVSSWKSGGFSFTNENVGFVAMLTPKNHLAKPFPNLRRKSNDELVAYLASPSHVYQLHSQRELLRRGGGGQRRQLLFDLATNKDAKLHGRIAAIFTLKQLDGPNATKSLLACAKDATIREWALRALTDRKAELSTVPLEPFVEALTDDNPRVRAQAVISLNRLDRLEAAESLLPLASRAQPPRKDKDSNKDRWRVADPDRVIPHLAVQALASLGDRGADEVCLKGLDSPHAAGAYDALKYMHSTEAIDGLLNKLNATRDETTRHKLLSALIRLYHREAEYKKGWWGTRPDTTGPYFDREEWDESPRIAETIKVVMSEANEATAKFLTAELDRHKVKIDGLSSDETRDANQSTEKQVAITVPKADPNNPDQIANLEFDATLKRALAHAGDVEKGKVLFAAQSCVACHTYANGQLPKGPHLVDIGKRYKREELIESILKPSAKLAMGFETQSIITDDGKQITGFVVKETADSIELRLATGILVTIAMDEIDERNTQKISVMPEGVVNNLTPESLADLLAYLESLGK